MDSSAFNGLDKLFYLLFVLSSIGVLALIIGGVTLIFWVFQHVRWI